MHDQEARGRCGPLLSKRHAFALGCPRIDIVLEGSVMTEAMEYQVVRFILKRHC